MTATAILSRVSIDNLEKSLRGEIMELRVTKNGEAIISGDPEDMCKLLEIMQQTENQNTCKLLEIIQQAGKQKMFKLFGKRQFRY